jgi:hypothetical protein
MSSSVRQVLPADDYQAVADRAYTATCGDHALGDTEIALALKTTLTSCLTPTSAGFAAEAPETECRKGPLSGQPYVLASGPRSGPAMPMLVTYRDRETPAGAR